MNLAHWLLRAAARAPDDPAIFEGTELVASYGAFADAARRMASGLIGLGIKPGDRVALFTPNCPDYLTSLLAIWTAGAVAVPINAKLHLKEAAWILENSETKIAFCGADTANDLNAMSQCDCISLQNPMLQEMWKLKPSEIIPRDPTDLAWLFYTSGTTGRPKGVMISHGMLQTVSLAYLAEVDETHKDHCAIYAAPMTHGAGLYALAHILKAARHIVPKSGKFDPAEVFSLASHHMNASMFAAPTMVKRLVDYAKSESVTGTGLKTIIYGGGPMYVADIVEAVDVLGPRFVQIYGQGECPMCITVLSRDTIVDRQHENWKSRLGSVGPAQAICELRIMDQSGECPTGEIGEIEVRSEAVMIGYWQNEQASAEAMHDGWLRTGDMGALDADGFLTLHDRSKDMIISGGSNIYPREVEEILLTHDKVKEAAVIAQPHPEWGEAVVAVIVGDASPEELDQLCQSQIAGFKRPRLYLSAQSLPKNNYGKVLKTDLREALAAGRLSPL